MIIKCKMCGGDIEFTPGATYGTCEYCGSTSTIPQAADEQKLNYYNRANHFRCQCEFDKALSAYEKLLEQDDTDAEAHWGAVISRYGIEYVEDPATGRRIPTCHRVQMASILADSDYLAAVEHAPDTASRDLYKQQAAEINEIQKGILAISASEEPYDVFICYKETDENGQRTRDSQWAQEVYYGLNGQGYKVFFSRITLEDKLGHEYEPYIFAALNSAKVMVVVGSRPEYFNAVWVKNEWSRYLALMAKDRKRLLIPCYRNMDPYDLPEELSTLQSQDMSKIGFMQDLLRGIKKVLDAEKQPEQPKAVVQQAAPVVDVNINALLGRGKMALAYGEMDKADEFFEKVFELDTEVAEAYMGKFLVGNMMANIESWVKHYLATLENDVHSNALTVEQTQEETAHIEQMVQRCVVAKYLSEERIRSLYQLDRTYPSFVSGWTDAIQYTAQQLKDKNLVHALHYATGALKERYDAAINILTEQLDAQLAAAKRNDEESVCRIREEAGTAFAGADAKAERMHEEALEQQARDLELSYEQACKHMEEAARHNSPSSYREAAVDFVILGAYRDSEQKKTDCLQAAEQLQQAEQAAQCLVKERTRRRKARLIIIASVMVVLIVSLPPLMVNVIFPNIRYRQAEALLATGQYQKASESFAALKGYKDAADRVHEPYYVQAEALLAAGMYDAAAEAFAKAIDYKGALKKSYNLKYAQGEGAVTVGECLTVGLRRDGTVVTVGSDFGDERKAGNWTDIVAVAAGRSHTVGLKRDGTVVAVGENFFRQCNVSNWTDIVAVTTGSSHTVGLRDDGTVVAVGYNQFGQCDVSNWTDIVAVAAGGSHTVGLKCDGTVVTVGYDKYGLRNIGNWTDIIVVAAGNYHTVGLKRDGTAVTVGKNKYGQCDVSNWTDIVAVAAGASHTVGLRDDGTVVAVGDNNYGQCNVSDWTNIVAVAAGTYNTVGLRRDGTVVVVGDNDEGQCNVSNWIDIGSPQTLD